MITKVEMNSNTMARLMKLAERPAPSLTFHGLPMPYIPRLDGVPVYLNESLADNEVKTFENVPENLGEVKAWMGLK